MRHLLHRIVLLLAIIVLAIPTTSNARKPPPSSGIVVTGNWSDCNIVTDTRPAGPGTILTLSVSQTLTGTLNGSFSGTEFDFTHPDGSAVFYGSGVFTGSVAGKTGTFKMHYIGTSDSNNAFTAHWVVSDGTGQLLNIFGNGTFEGTSSPATTTCADPFAGTYNGQLRFAGRGQH